MQDSSIPMFDAIIIGAGLSGMYQLIKLRELGLSTRVFETADDIGGTWYWNRYPGCCFDTESYTYNYSFSPEMLRDWSWSAEFAPQPETLRYYNIVAEKYEVRKDIVFNSRVTRAIYDASSQRWTVETDKGHVARSRFLISALGIFSAYQMPQYEGIESFKGDWWHSARWPRDPNGFGGKQFDFSKLRVAIIGTGSSGIQLIQEIGKTAKQLTVFQRRPHWTAPLNNKPISKERMEEIRANFPAIFKKCAESFSGTIYTYDPRSALSVSAEEREALYEKLYAGQGFGLWLSNFYDILIAPEANKTLAEFMARKIRARVKDPAVAEKLIPKEDGFATRRVPLESGYYEVYNQPNVELVDIRATPIKRITPVGIETTEGEREFDMIIYATGFDAVTGGLDRIDIVGDGGQKLRDKWSDGPKTFLGLQSVGFPNFFTLVGPHNAASFCNVPRCAEQNIEWVSDLIQYMLKKGYETVEPTLQAEARWTQEVYDSVKGTMLEHCDSYFFGSNTPGKKRAFLGYAAGAANYRQICNAIAASDYEGMHFMPAQRDSGAPERSASLPV